MATPMPPGRVRFGAFELDRRAGELRKSGTRVRLQERPLRVLEALVERPGDIVTRDELRRRLWSDDTFVDFDNGLNSAINRLRAALGDSAAAPRFVETVGRRGYRFVAPLTVTDPEPLPPRVSTSTALRLAVLPFRQPQPDPDTEFLAASLPDAIASALSGLESLAVRSPVAAARFGGEPTDLDALAAALDVTLALAGAVLKAGDRIRVSTQLVEVPRGTLRWTATAETTMADLFDVTDGLVARIVESLALPLTVDDARAVKLDVPGSGHAYELYLRANVMARTPATWREAHDLYRESLAADPDYAPAWARLGRLQRLTAKYAGDDDPEMTRLAEHAFRRALAINPELSAAHALYAQLEMETGRSIDALRRLLDRARLRPADAQLFVGLVQACRYAGLLAASRAAHERARRIDPTVKTSVAYTAFASGAYDDAVAAARDNDDPFEGFALAAAGRRADAVAVLTRTRERYGTNRIWAMYLDMALAFARGDRTSAIALADACFDVPFRDPEGLFQVGLLYAWLDEPGRALRALRRTVDAGFCCLPALDASPALAILREDRGFVELRTAVDARHRRAVEIFAAFGNDTFVAAAGSDR